MITVKKTDDPLGTIQHLIVTS